jgi:LysM repeat protein
VTDIDAYGTDLSHWNALSDANALKATGIEFAWCKATDGTGAVDATFTAKMAQLAAAGFTTGAYHFAEGSNAQAEAEHFLAVCADYLTDGHLFYMLDMEAAGVRADANQFVADFVTAVGKPCIVYGNLDWWTNVFLTGGWPEDTAGNIARYNGQPGSPGYTSATLAFNQFTDTLVRAGVAGNIDGDCTMPGHVLASYVYGGSLPTQPPAPPAAPPAPPAAAPNPWTVKSGDTLSAIASAWGVTVSAVAAANAIPNPNLIHIGQVIWKPGTGQAAPTPPPVGRYIVQAGDTLSAIASRENTTVAVLVALNHIANPDRIQVGQVLDLPATGGAAGAGSYTVKSGDTLSAIAARLNYPGGWPALAAFNHIAGPGYVIHPGETIRF